MLPSSAALCGAASLPSGPQLLCADFEKIPPEDCGISEKVNRLVAQKGGEQL